MIDSQEFIVKGMQRDLSVSKFNPEFAFENMNIRITAREDNTLLSITNEKGNKACSASLTPNKISRVMNLVQGGSTPKFGIVFKSEYPLDGPITLKSFPTPGYTEQGSIRPDGEIVLTNTDIEEETKFWISDNLPSIIFKSFDVISQSPVETVCYYDDTIYTQPIPEVGDVPLVLIGECIGKEVINDYLVLFTVTEDDPDGKNSRIYRLDYNGVSFTTNLLYYGNLGFDKFHPIESIGVFENETLQKVYWTDGLNQPRFINIVASDEKRKKWNDNSFNFVASLKLKELITVEKIASSGGTFPSGVVQYALSYYNRYGQQSNIFYTSPLLYNTFVSRGASPEEKVGIGYRINIDYPDTNFEYVRIYSIVRTSIDATPTVKRIADILIGKSSSLSYTDSNTSGDTVDPTELLYIGGEEAIFGCICQKDNTLFLGDIKLRRSTIPRDILKKLSSAEMTYGSKGLESIVSTKGSYYGYSSQLNKNSYEVTSFKYMETYRFGVQFLHTSGRWSEVIPLQDLKIKESPRISTGVRPALSICVPQFTFGKDLSPYIKSLIEMGYVKARGVVVYPSLSERSSICQGFACPTVYNVGDRANNSPYAQSSWFFRPSNLAALSTYVMQTFHNKPLYSTDNKGSEIQSMGLGKDVALPSPYVTDNDAERNKFISKYNDFYYVDGSICTFHSPDIEFDESINSLDFSNLQLRIIGRADVKALNWDTDVTLASPPLVSEVGGLVEIKTPGKNTDGNISFTPITSYVLYMDAHDKWGAKNDGNYNGGSAAFPVYVWHRDGSLANAQDNRYARLDKKKFSQLVYCGYPRYFEEEWSAPIVDAQIFNSNEITPLRLKGPSAFNQDTLLYYGNVDKLLTASRAIGRRDGYPLTVAGWTDRRDNASQSTGYVDPVEASTINTWAYINSLPNSAPDGYKDPWGGKATAENAIKMATDPIRIKYKSSPHAVFVFDAFSSSKQRTLPINWTETQDLLPGGRSFWNKNIAGSYSVSLQREPYDVTPSNLPAVWVCEFYRTSQPTFGGTSEDAYSSNKWVPAGPLVSISDANGNPIEFMIRMMQGDTYIQRYDHLKTYPFTLEDQNSLVEIVSIPLETRVNIDGRYDKNRGYPGLTLTPTNFNLMNDVYSQQDNFFTQQYIDSNRAEVDNFVNSATWTKTKSLSEDIDTWTNITLASTLDLDGDKGRLRAMKLFNNEIIAFQDNAISNILFNSRVQMNASDGIPIEIANSGKVDGKRYISNHIGTVNKFGIIETPLGLYFMDNNSTSIYQYNGQLNDISDGLGFRAWCSDHIKPDDFGKPLDQIFTGHYDRSNSDLYFNNPQYSLGFSSLLNQFTSFYSYENIPFMFNVRDKFFSLRLQGGNTEVWEQNAGDYNYYYGEFKPFYTHIIANKDMTKDKIFNTLEFRADSYDGENLLNYDTFDRLDVWNEYQRGSLNLLDRINHPSSLKKKFRVWKANFPREAGKPLNRIRNTWTNVKLGKYTPNKLRTVLHDMTVHYTV